MFTDHRWKHLAQWRNLVFLKFSVGCRILKIFILSFILGRKFWLSALKLILYHISIAGGQLPDWLSTTAEVPGHLGEGTPPLSSQDLSGKTGWGGVWWYLTNISWASAILIYIITVSSFWVLCARHCTDYFTRSILFIPQITLISQIRKSKLREVK